MGNNNEKTSYDILMEYLEKVGGYVGNLSVKTNATLDDGGECPITVRAVVLKFDYAVENTDGKVDTIYNLCAVDSKFMCWDIDDCLDDTAVDAICAQIKTRQDNA